MTATAAKTAPISKTTTETRGRDLVLTRVIDAPPAKVYEAWTNPEKLKTWFAPKPWTITAVNMDIRSGGASLVTMRSPDGQEFPMPGQFLEVVPNKRLVFTDAFTGAWQPSEKPFMTVTVDFEDVGGKTRYTAVVKHWTEADREAHEKMGFHVGWPICAEQLAALVE
jgi:uncharacterized protein YndB with AHSA1/START domain